jgi:ABC-type molybdate transport system substrate-binding protein
VECTVVVLVAGGRVTAVSCVVVVVVAAGSFTTVVQEVRSEAKAGTMQMSVSFFIIKL